MITFKQSQILYSFFLETFVPLLINRFLSFNTSLGYGFFDHRFEGDCYRLISPVTLNLKRSLRSKNIKH